MLYDSASRKQLDKLEFMAQMFFLLSLLKKLKKTMEKPLRFVRYCFIMFLSLELDPKEVQAWVN